LVASAKDTQWHWLTQDGVRQSGSQAELSTALSSGALLATTLVWRAGWAEWLAANIVAELAAAVPAGQRVPSREPKRDPNLLTPPALPVKAPPPPLRSKRTPPAKPAPAADPGPKSGLPPLTANIASRLDPKKDAPSDPAKDTLAPTSFGTIGRTRPAPQPVAVREPTAASVPLKGREPLPTLSEGEVQSATATLRPPGAVPPPARGVPAVPALDSAPSYALDKRSAMTTPVPEIEHSSRPGHEIVRAEEISDAEPPATEPRRVPLVPARSLPPVRARAESKRPAHHDAPLDSTLEIPQAIPPAARRTPVPGPPQEFGPNEDTAPRQSSASRSSLVRVGGLGVDSRTVLMVLSAICGALAVTVVALLFTHPRAPSSVAPTPAPSASDEQRTVDHACHLALPAARLASSIERTVPPNTVTVDGGVALGFAASKTRAAGLLIDPVSLDENVLFNDDAKEPLRGVVPLTQGERVSFLSDREDAHQRVAHLVDEKPPFSLGQTDEGFSRTQAGNVTLIWPLEADSKLTEPRVAGVGAAGYALTFRSGGQSGKVLLGFVDRQGGKKSELFEIAGAPKLLGTPVIAGNESSTVLAFAGRNAPEAPWKIFVATAPTMRAPGPARELVSGTGGGAISPAITALAGGRWLMQWTDGASGQYQVRVQTFTSDLIAYGSPLLVSPKGANAGQGALAALDKGALTLFILTTAGHDELWGASLSCQ
jgi:hypothetical protein